MLIATVTYQGVMLYIKKWCCIVIKRVLKLIYLLFLLLFDLVVVPSLRTIVTKIVMLGKWLH